MRINPHRAGSHDAVIPDGEQSVELDVFRTQILEYFSAAPLAHAVKTLAEAVGTVESRRIEEKFPESQ